MKVSYKINQYISTNAHKLELVHGNTWQANSDLPILEWINYSKLQNLLGRLQADKHTLILNAQDCGAFRPMPILVSMNAL